MSTDALSIIQDYLGSPELQVRKNAATALALVGANDAVTRLVEVATSDPHEDVRAWAVKELGALPPPLAAFAVDTLERGLGDKQTAEQSYVVLGSLRLMGAMPATGRFTKYLSIAAAAGWPRSVSALWRMPVQLLVACVLVAFLSGVVLPLACNWLMGITLDGDDVLSLSLLGAFASLLLTWTCSRRLFPLGSHFDMRAGFIAESLATALSGGAFAVVVWGIFLLANHEHARDPHCFANWVSVVVLASAWTRMGAMWGAAVATSVGASGVVARLVATISAIFAGLVGGASALYFSLGHVEAESNSLHGLLVALLAPGICGLGAALAFAETAPKRARISQAALTLIAFVVLLPLAPLVTLRATTPSTPSAETVINASGSNNLQQNYDLSTFPHTVKVTSKLPLQMKAAVSLVGPSRYDPVMALSDSSGGESKRFDDNGTGEGEVECMALRPGTSTLTISDFEGIAGGLERARLDNVVPRMLKSFTARPAIGKLVLSLREPGSAAAAADMKDCGNTVFAFKEAVRVQLPIGLLQAGAVVEIRKPVDTDEGPGWVSDMDDVLGKKVKVASVIDEDPTDAETRFRLENQRYTWDSRWIISLTPPASAASEGRPQRP